MAKNTKNQITEAYAFVSVVTTARIRLLKAISEGQKVPVILTPEISSGKVKVLFADNQQHAGTVMPSDMNTYLVLAKKEPATNTVLDAHELFKIMNRSEVSGNIVSSPATGIFKVYVNLENLSQNAEETSTTAAPVEESKIDLSMFSESDAAEVKARLDYITKSCAYTKKVGNNIAAAFVSFMQSHENIRHFEPLFINNAGIVDAAIKNYLCGNNLALTGPKGVGKNVLVEHLASLFDQDVCDMQMSYDTSKEEIRGEPTFLDDGKIGVRLSNILEAAEKGSIICLDEANMLRGSISSILHSATDHRRYIEVPGYGKVKVHPQTRFIITMNEGDEYEGTRQLNAAFRDRFHEIIFKPNPDGMKEVFMTKCNLDDAEATALAKLYKLIHAAVYNADSDAAIPEVYLSQRKFVTAGNLYSKGFANSIDEAFREAVIDTIVDEEIREILSNLILIHCS